MVHLGQANGLWIHHEVPLHIRINIIVSLSFGLLLNVCYAVSIKLLNGLLNILAHLLLHHLFTFIVCCYTLYIKLLFSRV